MKNKTALTLLILTMLAIISCSKSASSPEEAVKASLDNVVKGDYESALDYWIDSNGNQISKEVRQTMINSMKNSPLTSYRIIKVEDVNTFLAQTEGIPQSDKDRFLSLLKGFEDAKIVTATLTQGASSPEVPFFVVKYKGSWKLLMPQ